MKIVIDGYGGDHAPHAVLHGAAQAVAEYGVEILITGNEQELQAIASEEQISLQGVSFLPAEGVIPVEADPTEIKSTYKNSSLAVAVQAVANGTADAVVSAGSTGAIVVAATLWAKRIKGIKRPALGVLIPDTEGVHMLIDSGANSECRAEMLLQFGIMGSVYMQQVLGLEQPRIGVVNIGTESNKGLVLQKEAAELLSHAPVHFIGNVESSQLPLHGCDVAVTDGFTGNIILKHTEGMAKMMGRELKQLLLSNTSGKLAALLLKKNLKKMMKKLDASEYGGTPLLGIAKPVIKAHGNSNSLAIKNAIKQAKLVTEQRIIPQIEQALAGLGEQGE